MKSDTPPEIETRLDELMATRSGSDRVRMTCEMFDLARALAIADIRARRRDITEAEMRIALFDRFYSEDFSVDERERITRLIAEKASRRFSG